MSYSVCKIRQTAFCSRNDGSMLRRWQRCWKLSPYHRLCCTEGCEPENAGWRKLSYKKLRLSLQPGSTLEKVLTCLGWTPCFWLCPSLGKERFRSTLVGFIGMSMVSRKLVFMITSTLAYPCLNACFESARK